MTTDLKEKLALLPPLPGVYLMKDAGGDIIYVGKAQNLKKRVSSYFRSPEQLDSKTGILVQRVSTFDTIITGTEKEALILESNLIKKHQPKYNVILKDDKRYPALRLDIREPYPNLTIVRKIGSDNAMYFGPFASAQAVRQTLKIIQRTFKLRKCKTREFQNRTRPCLDHQMGLCMGPCRLPVDQHAYAENVKEAVLFLKGRTTELIEKIKTQMQQAAECQDYETAAALRDKMFALEKTLEKQVSVTTDLKNRDVLAVAVSEGAAVINLLRVRGGYLVGSRNFNFTDSLSSEAEMLRAFLHQFYDGQHFVPEEILLPILPEGAAAFEDLLGDIKGARVKILAPRRGEKVRLLNMAFQNAANRLKDLMAQQTAEMGMLYRLQSKLRMDRPPLRIECIDNSNLSGRQPVAALVVFMNGKPQKSAYRKYRLASVSGPDDYACMAEVFRRRFGKGPDSIPYPDLLLVDGGRGHLNVGMTVLKTLEMEHAFKVIGIAKKVEQKRETADKVYQPGRVNPIDFSRDVDLLFFLQRIRDEAHRFAVTFHRNRRRADSMQSIWDTIPGIGKQRKKILLKHFGSIKKIRAATLEELSRLPGINERIAGAIKDKLGG